MHLKKKKLYSNYKHHKSDLFYHVHKIRIFYLYIYLGGKVPKTVVEYWRKDSIKWLINSFQSFAYFNKIITFHKNIFP